MPTIVARGETIIDHPAALPRHALVASPPREMSAVVATQLARAGFTKAHFSDGAVARLADTAAGMLRPLTGISQAAALLAESEHAPLVTAAHVDRVVAIRQDVVGSRSASRAAAAKSIGWRRRGWWLAAVLVPVAAILLVVPRYGHRKAPTAAPATAAASPAAAAAPPVTAAAPPAADPPGPVAVRAGDLASGSMATALEPVDATAGQDQVASQPDPGPTLPVSLPEAMAAPDGGANQAASTDAAPVADSPPQPVDNGPHTDSQSEQPAAPIVPETQAPSVAGVAPPAAAPARHASNRAVHHGVRAQPRPAPVIADEPVDRRLATIEPPKPQLPQYWTPRR